MKIITKSDLIALDNSIDHWYTNLMLAHAGELSEIDISGLVCDCCQQSHTVAWNCDNCPMVKVGMAGDNCQATPFLTVYLMCINRAKFRDNNIIESIKLIESIEAMVNHLELARVKAWDDYFYDHIMGDCK